MNYLDKKKDFNMDIPTSPAIIACNSQAISQLSSSSFNQLKGLKRPALTLTSLWSVRGWTTAMEANTATKPSCHRLYSEAIRELVFLCRASILHFL